MQGRLRLLQMEYWLPQCEAASGVILYYCGVQNGELCYILCVVIDLYSIFDINCILRFAAAYCEWPVFNDASR